MYRTVTLSLLVGVLFMAKASFAANPFLEEVALSIDDVPICRDYAYGKITLDEAQNQLTQAERDHEHNYNALKELQALLIEKLSLEKDKKDEIVKLNKQYWDEQARLDKDTDRISLETRCLNSIPKTHENQTVPKGSL